MLREVLKIGVWLSVAMLIYDVHKTGFYNSEVYDAMKESGLVEYGERFMHQMEIFYTKAIRFRENGAHITVPRLINFDFKPYRELIHNLHLFIRAVLLEEMNRYTYNLKRKMEMGIVIPVTVSVNINKKRIGAANISHCWLRAVQTTCSVLKRN